MLEKLGVITGIMPIGGWRYVQTLPQGGAQRIPNSDCAGTDDALVEQVRTFRINQGIDVGEVEKDVALYIRQQSPINDRFPGQTPVAARVETQTHRPYINRIKDWLMSMGRKNPRYVSEDEADARAEICMICPHNVPWKVKCEPCCVAVESRAHNVRARATYKHDKQLGACRLHDTHNSTAIFIDRDDLPAKVPNAPLQCWMPEK